MGILIEAQFMNRHIISTGYIDNKHEASVLMTFFDALFSCISQTISTVRRDCQMLVAFQNLSESQSTALNAISVRPHVG